MLICYSDHRDWSRKGLIYATVFSAYSANLSVDQEYTFDLRKNGLELDRKRAVRNLRKGSDWGWVKYDFRPKVCVNCSLLYLKLRIRNRWASLLDLVTLAENPEPLSDLQNKNGETSYTKNRLRITLPEIILIFLYNVTKRLKFQAGYNLHSIQRPIPIKLHLFMSCLIRIYKAKNFFRVSKS